MLPVSLLLHIFLLFHSFSSSILLSSPFLSPSLLSSPVPSSPPLSSPLCQQLLFHPAHSPVCLGLSPHNTNWMICCYSLTKSWYWQEKVLIERVPSVRDWKYSVWAEAGVYLSLWWCPCSKVCTYVFLWSASGTDGGGGGLASVNGLAVETDLWLQALRPCQKLGQGWFIKQKITEWRGSNLIQDHSCYI